MKNIRTLLIAVSALVLMNTAQAQSTLSTDASAKVGVTTPVLSSNASVNAGATQSADPLVAKRQADSEAKAEYKARKKAAKKKMRAEKHAAKDELKDEKETSTDIRNKAMAAEPTTLKAGGNVTTNNVIAK